MKKKVTLGLLSLVLVLFSVLGVTPPTGSEVKADSEQKTTFLLMPGENNYSSEARNGAGWSYDGKGVLTLNGVNFTDSSKRDGHKQVFSTKEDGDSVTETGTNVDAANNAISFIGDLTIIVSGTNNVGYIEPESTYETIKSKNTGIGSGSAGSLEGSLTINGNGVLNSSSYICVQTLDISGITLNLTGVIQAETSIKVSDSTVSTPALSSFYLDDYLKKIEITRSKITLKDGDSDEGNGINATNIDIKDSTISGKGDLYSGPQNDTDYKGGTINIVGSDVDLLPPAGAWGVCAQGDKANISIENSNIKIKTQKSPERPDYYVPVIGVEKPRDQESGKFLLDRTCGSISLKGCAVTSTPGSFIDIASNHEDGEFGQSFKYTDSNGDHTDIEDITIERTEASAYGFNVTPVAETTTVDAVLQNVFKQNLDTIFSDPLYSGKIDPKTAVPTLVCLSDISNSTAEKDSDGNYTVSLKVSHIGSSDLLLILHDKDHNGSYSEVIYPESVEDGVVTFKTSSFSKFALLKIQTALKGSDASIDNAAAAPVSTGSTQVAAADSSNNTPAAKAVQNVKKSPRTGDSMATEFYLAAALAALAGIITLTAFRKRKEK